MAHELRKTDNMIFTGERPWHGLGKEIAGNLTPAQAMNEAGLNWTVSTQPLYRTGVVEPIQSARVIVRDSDGYEMGTCGPRYVPLQNADAFAFFNPFIEQGFARIETAGSLKDGQHVWALARITDGPEIEIGKGDIVNRYLLLSNAHNGVHAIRVGFTPVRVVCWNTLSASHASDASKLIRVKHSSKTGFNLANIRATMDTINSEFAATAEQYAALQTRGISRSDLFKYVKLVWNLDPVKNERKFIATMELVETEFNTRGNDGKTWWNAYNAITAVLSHHEGRTTDNRYHSLWFGAGAGVNARALSTALSLAL